MALSKYFGEILLSLAEFKRIYQFNKNRKHIVSWGTKSYGYPQIMCYDNISTLSVGNYVSIARNVSILLGANHKRGLITTYPHSRFNPKVSQSETNERGNVIIGNDVWIGFGTTIIGEVTVGNGAIIGAGAVVVSDIPPYSVAVGVPAKAVKYRFDEDIIEKLQKIAWWDRDQEELREMEELLYSDDIPSFLKKYNGSSAKYNDGNAGII